VWAIDVILKMGLPEFRLQAPGGEPVWHDLMAAEALAVGGSTPVECDGHGVFVYCGSGGLRASDNRCPHETTNIPHLALAGTRLTCPKHEWAFDLTTGQCIEKGSAPLTARAMKFEYRRLWAYW
jgi:nitrite reductase/ring-hydroxylating ferredoxin subunit